MPEAYDLIVTIERLEIMTGSNSSSTDRTHHMLHSALVGAILGGIIGVNAFANPEFSLSVRAEHNLFHLEVASGAIPSEPKGAADAE